MAVQVEILLPPLGRDADDQCVALAAMVLGHNTIGSIPATDHSRASGYQA